MVGQQKITSFFNKSKPSVVYSEKSYDSDDTVIDDYDSDITIIYDYEQDLQSLARSLKRKLSAKTKQSNGCYITNGGKKSKRPKTECGKLEKFLEKETKKRKVKAKLSKSSTTRQKKLDSDEDITLIDEVSSVSYGKPSTPILTSWTKKYLPQFEKCQVATFKEWLASWHQKFVCKIDCEDSDDEDPVEEKCFFLHGPSGTGKTSLIYTVAEELDYKVLEYNAATIKICCSLFQKQINESLQSYCITNTSSAFASLFRSSKSQQQLSKSIILFDDIDAIIYENNSLNLFWRTFKQVILDARKPIVLTSALEVFFLTNELHFFKNVRLNRVKSDVMNKFIDTIYNSESKFESTKLAKTLIRFDGDMRKLVNQLQFWFEGFTSVRPPITSGPAWASCSTIHDPQSLDLYSLDDILQKESSKDSLCLLHPENSLDTLPLPPPPVEPLFEQLAEFSEHQSDTRSMLSYSFRFDFIQFYQSILHHYPAEMRKENLRRTRSKRKQLELPPFL